MRDIHSSAVIDPKAEIGEDVKVGPFTVIGPDVVIGPGCVIHNHVTLSGCTTLAANVHVFPGAAVGLPPQDLKFKGERTTLSVGENTVLRECCTLHIGTELGGGKTVVGSNNLIMAYVHIAHDCLVKNNIVIANGSQLAGHVVVEDGARISGLAAVHHFVRIGACAFVAGCAKLSIDVPPFTLAEGHPARIRGLNKEGLKRRGLTPAAQEALKDAYRLCFRDELSQDQAFKEIHERGCDKFTEVAMFVDFIRATSRGRHGRALEAERESVPADERDGRLNFKIAPDTLRQAAFSIHNETTSVIKISIPGAGLTALEPGVKREYIASGNNLATEIHCAEKVLKLDPVDGRKYTVRLAGANLQVIEE